MPTVFTSKIAIPGDRIHEYLEAREQAQRQREPFKKSLLDFNNKFHDSLTAKFTKKTARKHAGIVSMFIEFIAGYTDVESVEAITKGMANSYFRRWYKKKVWDKTTESEIKTALKKFFTYLKEEENVINDVVLKSL